MPQFSVLPSFASSACDLSNQFLLMVWFSEGSMVHTHVLMTFVFSLVSFLNSVLVWKLCKDFDIFWFRSAIANPWVISVLNGGCLWSSAALIKVVWNQPLCWSMPSRTKSQLGVVFLSVHTRLASNQTSTTSVICFQFCFWYLLYRVLSLCHR